MSLLARLGSARLFSGFELDSVRKKKGREEGTEEEEDTQNEEVRREIDTRSERVGIGVRGRVRVRVSDDAAPPAAAAPPPAILRRRCGGGGGGGRGVAAGAAAVRGHSHGRHYPRPPPRIRHRPLQPRWATRPSSRIFDL